MERQKKNLENDMEEIIYRKGDYERYYRTIKELYKKKKTNVN